MSGIAGIFYFDGTQDVRPTLRPLTNAMSRRGPDGQAMWIKGSIGFGHCLLYSTPESLHETLPREDSSSGLAITSDARIDNRQELISKLYLKDRCQSTLTDSELILKAYEKWGENCAAQLLGDFAFAIWDSRQQRLYCACDHLGAKNFTFICNKQFFAFATEGEALLSLPGVSKQPNDELIAHFLFPAFQDFPPQKNWLSEIDILIAGQQLIITEKGIPLRTTYWRLEPVNHNEESHYVSETEVQEAFLDVFSAAVECRLRSAGAPAAMMSGGMDSASIKAMTNQILSQSSDKIFHTYSAISDTPASCQESQRIQILTKENSKQQANFVSVPSFTGMITLDDVIEAAWSKAHPVDNSILLPAMMCLAASRNNHRTLLHGTSGDLTTHSPNHYIANQLRQGQLRDAWRECGLASNNHTYMHFTGAYEILARNIWAAWTPACVKKIRYKINQSPKKLDIKNSLLAPGLANRLKIEERIQAQYFKAIQATPKDKCRKLVAEITSALRGFGRVAGHYGVDLRDPWADRRVIEFFLKLPLKYKVNNGWTKYIVRATFANELGSQVCWHHGKEHLGLYFIENVMKRSDERINRLCTNNLDTLGAYINKGILKQRIKQYKTQRRRSELLSLYDIITLDIWLKKR